MIRITVLVLGSYQNLVPFRAFEVPSRALITDDVINQVSS